MPLEVANEKQTKNIPYSFERGAAVLKSPLSHLRRVLLVRNDRIGDLVLSLPAFEAVRRALPHAHITALVSRYAGPLLSGCRAVDELLVDDPAETGWQLGRRLKKGNFDAAVILNTNTRNCLAVWRAGVPIRVSWAHKPAGLLLGNRRMFLRRSHPPVHESEFALALVRRLGIEAKLADLAPHLEIDTVTRERIAKRVRQDFGDGPVFGVHPGNLKSAYNWPVSHYSALVGRLAQHGGVMLTGSAAERPLLESIRNQLENKRRERVRLYSDLNVPELAAALAEQTALTASSTGPMHIAGVLGTPVVALFSPHPAHVPKKWAPLGDQHTLFVAPLLPGEDPRIPREQGTAVMARISVEEVLEANLRYAHRAVAPVGGEQAAHRHAYPKKIA